MIQRIRDWLRERRISRHYRRMIRAHDAGHRSEANSACQRMRAEIRRRSIAQVARMEQARGLR